MNENEKLVVILCDIEANYEYIIIQKSVNLKEEYEKYDKWIRNKASNVQYMSFCDWLIKLGARKTDEKDMEIFNEI